MHRVARIAEEDQVVARPDGEGRVVIETVRSIRERVWGAAPGTPRLTVARQVTAHESLRIASFVSGRFLRSVIRDLWAGWLSLEEPFR